MVQYDAAGHITSDGSNSFAYSDRGRMTSATNAGGTVVYQYNGLNQRVYKSGPMALVPTGAAYYLYNEAGQLLGEYNASGAPVYETIYLGNMPVGVLKQTGAAVTSDIAVTVHNVYADHIATPRIITRQDQQIVWRWDTAEAFGATMPEQNPGSLGVFTYNQRFPGQVFDQETGLFQNWNREYNARLGRYIQSDPIGLAGGINTFAYVNGSPINLSDPTGEWAINGAGAVLGIISGGVGGYITAGTWSGTWKGAVAGGVIGLVNPFASTFGAYAGGVAANLVGQAVGNLDTCNPVMDVNVELALLSGGGGAGGYRLAAWLANPRRSASSYILSQRLGTSAAMNKYGGSVVEGYIGGLTELGLNSLRNDTPANNCSCRAK